MLFISLSTLLWLLFFQSIGNSLLALLRFRPQNPFLAVWLGFFATAFLCLCMAIWVPVGSNAVRAVLGTAALPGILPTLRDWHALFISQKKRTLLLCGFCVCLLLLAQSFASCFTGMGYDTDLYHQQVVSWLKEYGIVPGLGNLHNRLAQVSGWLALAAFMDWGPFQARTAFLLPPLWLVAVILYFFYGVCRSPLPRQRLYLLCMLVFSCIYIWKSFYPNLYYDRPALIFYILIISELISAFLTISSREQLVKNLTIIFILAAASVLFKPIAVPTLFFLLALIFPLLCKKTIRLAELPRILWLPALTAALWCVINSLHSGYPIFPLTLISLPVDWLMPTAAVESCRHAVQGWARWPAAGYAQALDAGLPYWFGPWLERNLADKVFLGGVAAPFVAGVMLWGVAFCRHGCQWRVLFVFSLVLAQCLYWFFQHPDYRFGLEFFWAWAALGMTFAVSGDQLARIPWTKAAQVFLLLIACIAVVKCLPLLASAERRAALHPMQLPPQHAPFPGVHPLTIHAGTPRAFTIFIPAAGEDRCGNSPLPAAPSIPPRLFMRAPGDPGKGFSVHPMLPGQSHEAP